MIQNYIFKPKYYRFGCLFLWLFLGIFRNGEMATADVQNVPATSVGLHLQFAIADFDGDHAPDLASIQNGLSSSGAINYWIQLKSSTVGRQSVPLPAPAAELLIEAQDVNGDDAVDLVITTASPIRPVAILLNDGKGEFSRIDPATFPGAFREYAANWVSASAQQRNTIGISLPSRNSIFSEALDLLGRQSPSGTISHGSEMFTVTFAPLFQAGRAPPSEFSRT
jgi:hypothetical protein